MKLIADVVDVFVNDLAMQLSGGSLELYSGTPPVSAVSGMATFRTPLASFQFLRPGFAASIRGQAQMFPVEKVVILESGDATWGRLVTADGKPLALLSIAKQGTEAAGSADLLFKRVDLSQGGLVECEDFALKLPSVG